LTHLKFGAANETRTRDIHVGNVMLYQLSYSRLTILNLSIHTQTCINSYCTNEMVPEAGLEPAHSYKRGILNPLCLPIPPLGRCGGGSRSRTEVHGFAIRCIATLPTRHLHQNYFHLYP
jgi:hypothetical protein